MVRNIFTSSPHYIYPNNNLYFAPVEYEEKLLNMQTSRESIANEVLSKLVNIEDEVLQFAFRPGIIVGAVARYCHQATGIGFIY
jgi:hypothetical protein